MISQNILGPTRFGQLRALVKLVAANQVSLAGNKKLKIYGKLNCKAGMRMKAQNRLFFIDEQEAIALGYRPCASCMRYKYQNWKLQNGNRSNSKYH